MVAGSGSGGQGGSVTGISVVGSGVVAGVSQGAGVPHGFSTSHGDPHLDAAGVIQLAQSLEIGLLLTVDMDRTKRVKIAVVFIVELIVIVGGNGCRVNWR